MQEIHGSGLGVSDLIVLVMILVGLVVSASEIVLNYKNSKALASGLIMAVSTLLLPAAIAIYSSYIPEGNYTAHTMIKHLKSETTPSEDYTFNVSCSSLNVDGLEYKYNKQESNALVRVYSSPVQLSSITITLMGTVQYHDKDIKIPSKIKVEV